MQLKIVLEGIIVTNDFFTSKRLENSLFKEYVLGLMSHYYNWVKNGCVIQKVDKKLNDQDKHMGTKRIKDELLERYGVIVS